MDTSLVYDYLNVDTRIAPFATDKRLTRLGRKRVEREAQIAGKKNIRATFPTVFFTSIFPRSYDDTNSSFFPAPCHCYIPGVIFSIFLLFFF